MKGESEAGLLGEGAWQTACSQRATAYGVPAAAPLRAGLFALDLSPPHCSALQEMECGRGPRALAPRSPCLCPVLPHLRGHSSTWTSRGWAAASGARSAQHQASLHHSIRPPGMQAGPGGSREAELFLSRNSRVALRHWPGRSSRGHGTVSASEPPTGGLLLCLHLPTLLICSRCPVASPLAVWQAGGAGVVCV